jgi:5'-3' exonuclease
MGVPAFFRKLVQKYKIIRSNPDMAVSSLYIDANCLFHPQCFKELDLNKDVTDQQVLFNKMSKRIIAYINYLIRLVDPQDLVYIAVDGVAPLAKINQQRIRRFGYANNYKQNIYRKHNIKFNDSWSNIVITPGTDFMSDLHGVLKNYYEKFFDHDENKKTNRRFKIIYDSYLTPGEGEHKILQFMKLNNIKSNNTKANVIYGLDADLIFLAMASHIPNIFLLRESSQFTHDGNNDNSSIEEELLYADIELTKKFINEEYNKYYQDYINKDKIIQSNIFDNDDTSNEEKVTETTNIASQVKTFDFVNDYIFICYFLGNDFLPHLPSIDINNQGLELIQEVYMDIFEEIGTNLITINKNETININTQFLTKFITRLASYEDVYFRKTLPDYLKKMSHRRCYETEPHKREIWNIENLKDVKVNDNIKLGHGRPDEWKYRYYSHYFHTDEHMDKTVNAVCLNYIEGLVWVSKYYFEKCPSWKWQYRYSHPPFLSDLAQFIKNMDIAKDVEIKYHDPIDMHTQLVSVIPPSFSHILPKSLQHLNSSKDSPIIDMFPLTYEIDMIYKTQLYKCIPMIPYLDIDRVDQAVKQVVKQAVKPLA